MKWFFSILLFGMTLFKLNTAQAFQANHWWAGLGLYSENALNKVAEKKDGSQGVLGTTNLPLIFRYDWAITQNWFLAPNLKYTIIPRQTEGNSAEVNILHLTLPLGKNIGAFEWSIGPGIFRETIKGKGGTVTLNNGTGTSTFAQPGQEATIQKLSLDIGSSYKIGRFRFGLDIYFLSPLSEKERTQNLLLSLNYDLSGSNKGGGSGMFSWSL